jgi:hypothetical protein
MDILFQIKNKEKALSFLGRELSISTIPVKG